MNERHHYDYGETSFPTCAAWLRNQCRHFGRKTNSDRHIVWTCRHCSEESQKDPLKAGIYTLKENWSGCNGVKSHLNATHGLTHEGNESRYQAEHPAPRAQQISILWLPVGLLVSIVLLNLGSMRSLDAQARTRPVAVLVDAEPRAFFFSLASPGSTGLAGNHPHTHHGYANSSWYSPRLSLRNDEGAIAWPPAESNRKESQLRSVAASCRMHRRRDPHPRAKRRLRMIGTDDLAAGRWNRFWAVAECLSDARERSSSTEEQRMWVPCCSGGDVLDVQMESPISKVAVDRVYDIGDTGIYEVQLYLRKKHPAYTLAVHLAVSGIPLHERILLARKSPQKGASWVRGMKMTPYPRGSHRATVAVTLGHDVVPMQRPCTAADAFHADVRLGAEDFRDRFRFGAWYHLGSDACDGVHCDGSTTALDTEGWVWASDYCRVQLFTATEATRRLLNKSTFAWGASTLREPLDIMYSSLLGGEVRTESSAHPLWWAWSGCTNESVWSIGKCRARGYGVGFSTWPRAAGIFANATRPFDHVLIERTAWLTDDASEVVYFFELRKWLELYRQERKMRNQTKPPVQIFHNFVAWWYTAKSPDVMIGHLDRHWGWLLEDYMIANASEFIFISRQEMTLPLHFGDTFVQSRDHYGFTARECRYVAARMCETVLEIMNIKSNTGGGGSSSDVCSTPWIQTHLSDVRSSKELKGKLQALADLQSDRCVRKTHGDAAVVAAWLNVFLTE